MDNGRIAAAFGFALVAFVGVHLTYYALMEACQRVAHWWESRGQ